MDGVLLLERWKNPMTLLSKQIAGYQADTVDVHWWEDQLVPYDTQINYGTNYNSSATGFEVDDATVFVVGDLVRIVDTDEVVLVTTMSDSGDWIGVVRDYGQTEGWTARAAAVNDNYYLHRIGSAYEQGYPIPSIVSTQVTEVKNYCQDIRSAFGFTDIVRDTKQRGEDDAALQERKKAIEHTEKIEMINFFGQPYAGDKGLYSSTTGNTAPTVAGGINYFLVNENNSNLLKDETDLTMFEFQAYLEHLFDKGSNEKFMFCPPALLTGLEQWGITKMTTYARQKVLGMPITTWDSPHGIVHFVKHDMLKAPASTLYNYCFGLDMDKLGIVTIPNGITKLVSLDLRHSTGETMTKKEYQTIQCIYLKQPLAHGRLRFKTVSAT